MLPIRIRNIQNQDLVDDFIKSGINPVVARCLVSRGVTDKDVALLNHKLLSYKGLKGIQKMGLEIAQAIQRKEKMVVVADYDCDGATACAIAVSGLGYLGADIDFVVPNRLIHGYGLTPSVVDIVAEKNPKWIITVDNGTASIDGVRAANEKGIGVWVTDHHLPGDTLPDAAGIVNPNQPGCTFASKNLAGCGVMFYVLACVRDALRFMGDEKAKSMDVSDWLDIVALGTVADVVKLDDNNRWLVNQGIQRIRQGNMCNGIAALYEVSRKDYTRACSQDFGFALGPRLNAAGRLTDMSIGIRCLLSNDYEEALELAKELQVLNEERKNIENIMKDTAWATMESEKQKDNFTRVVFGEDFHEGVIGIVAGRIKERDFAPTIVFAPAQEDGGWKGSGRSIPGLHLRDVLDNVYKKYPSWFVKFGGHSMAAGLTITSEGKEGFAQEFERAVRDWFDGERPSQELVVDGHLPIEYMNVETAMALSDNVWGQGFEEPIWVGEFAVNKVDMIGQEKNHLKMNVSPMGSEECFDALHFFQTEENAPQDGDVIQIAYRIQRNFFAGKEKLDLIIVDR